MPTIKKKKGKPFKDTLGRKGGKKGPSKKQKLEERPQMSFAEKVIDKGQMPDLVDLLEQRAVHDGLIKDASAKVKSNRKERKTINEQIRDLLPPNKFEGKELRITGGSKPWLIRCVTVPGRAVDAYKTEDKYTVSVKIKPVKEKAATEAKGAAVKRETKRATDPTPLHNHHAANG